MILLCVPTPLGPHREPDLSFVLDSTRMIARVLRRGQLVVLESTTYPGTTRDELLPILQQTGLRCGEDFFLAYSPEREAFGSDRRRGHGNVFVLKIADGTIRPVTNEFWAARPAWSSDSRSLLYLSHAVGSIKCAGKAGVHRISADGGGPQALTDRTRVIPSVWFAADGTPEWVVWKEEDGQPTRSVI